MADNKNKPDNDVDYSEALSDFINSPLGQKLAEALAKEIDDPEGSSLQGLRTIVPERGPPQPPIVTTRVGREPTYEDMQKQLRLEDMDMPVPEKRREASRRALAPRTSEELEADKD